jgi:hypothetical protein
MDVKDGQTMQPEPSKELFGMTYLEIGVVAALALIAVFLTGYVLGAIRLQDLPASDVTPAATKKNLPRSIPGLDRGLLTSHLNKISVSCGPAQFKGQSWYITTCNGSSYGGRIAVQVEVSSLESTDGLYRIVARVIQKGDNSLDLIAIDTLGYIATIPHTNAEPDRARAWVRRFLPIVTLDTLESDRPKEIIGGVTYRLGCGAAETRCIVMLLEKEPIRPGKPNRAR